MVTATSATFNAAMTAFRRWQDTPWGRLRYSLAEANLARHLDGRPLRALDVGGGNGVDAVRLAVQGHRVTIVDSSAQMLAAAREIAARAGVSSRITCVEGNAETLADIVGADWYDLVLCHNLLQYVADAEVTLRGVLAPLRPGGLLPVISVNVHSDALRPALNDIDPVPPAPPLHRQAACPAP